MTLWTFAQQAATQDNGDSSYIIWGGALAGVAIVLLLIELFIPSGGLIGVLAGVAAIASLVAFYQYDVTLGFAMTGVYLVLTPILIVAFFKLWLNSPVGRRLILGGDQGGTEISSEETTASAEDERRRRLAALRELIGTEGVTVSALRPVGRVKIGNQRIDALAESGLIAANTPVVVVDVYDNQIKVRQV